MSEPTIVPVILSGGAGTRLWPMSRAMRPKQFLPLTGERSMLAATADRVSGVPGLGTPLVVCSAEHGHLVRRELGDDARLILEPVGRNTAPAVAAAAMALSAGDDPVLLVLPADHEIEDKAALEAAIVAGAALAVSGRMVTFGVVPTRPETGYGYIRSGDPIDDDAYVVEAFVEKPDADTAARYVASGRYSWNSGMFMFRASQYLEELERHEPEIVAAVTRAVAAGTADGDLRLDPEGFAACPSNSIDFAVMEHTDAAAVIPLDAGWSDVGSWSSLWELSDRDGAKNVPHGDVVMVESSGSLAWSEGRLVATVGVEDLVVVETADAVLVVPRARAQKVKDLVSDLRDRDRGEATQHSLEVRPWGSFEILAAGDRYQVKRLVVDPGSKLSLQAHRHRAEEWSVVNGTARVTLDDDVLTVPEGGTVSVGVGARHRLENPGQIPLVVIEVQLGSYLGEDDIVRFADDYGRS